MTFRIYVLKYYLLKSVQGGNTMAYKIVTISRQYGSGGRAVGKKLADALGYSFLITPWLKRLLKKRV
jgi:hypothetical protein